MSTTVYRNFDSDALYAQYNNRAMLPAEELAAIKGDQETRSAAYRESAPKKHLNLDYGSQDRERLDLFLPAADGAPLFAYIHGGYWQWNDKEGCEFLAKPFVEAGAAFANIEYSLCPAVTLAELVDQIRSALAWLWREADGYGYDRRRIVVSGHSAGGHLTAMAMATDWRAFGDDLPVDLVAGGLPISGVYDVEPIRLTPLNDAVKLMKEDVAPLSPMFLEPATLAPMVVAYGGAESGEFERHARELAATWAAHGVPAEVLTVPGANHFTALSALADPAGEMFGAAKRLLGLA
ncbi:MAG: alpha/beta hydrolase [Rhodospirillaceae bacterium]